MLEAKSYKSSFVAQTNKRLDLSTTENISEVDFFFKYICAALFEICWYLARQNWMQQELLPQPTWPSAVRPERCGPWTLKQQRYNAVVFSSTWHVSG